MVGPNVNLPFAGSGAAFFSTYTIIPDASRLQREIGLSERRLREIVARINEDEKELRRLQKEEETLRARLAESGERVRARARGEQPGPSSLAVSGSFGRGDVFNPLRLRAAGTLVARELVASSFGVRGGFSSLLTSNIGTWLAFGGQTAMLSAVYGMVTQMFQRVRQLEDQRDSFSRLTQELRRQQERFREDLEQQAREQQRRIEEIRRESRLFVIQESRELTRRILIHME